MKPAAAEEPETEEESPDEPEAASTADSTEATSEKPAGAKMSQTLLEQVSNKSCVPSVVVVIGNIMPIPSSLLDRVWWQRMMSSQLQWSVFLNDLDIAEVLSCLPI